MSVNFKPLADRVLVEPAPAEQKTASGIIIPDTAKEKPLKGKVISVGAGKKRRTHDIEARGRRTVWSIFGNRNQVGGQNLPHHERVGYLRRILS